MPKDENMSEWLQLRRLERNDLPLPKYETKHSAGIDFAACLTRPCKQIDSSGQKRKFLTISGGMLGSTPPQSLIKQRSHITTGRHYYDTDQIPNIDQGEPFPLIVQGQETIMIPLGYQCEFGKDFVLNLHVRSSVGLKGLILANATGIIDPDYRGDLFACLWNRTNLPLLIEHGQRIVQGVLLGFSQAHIQETKNLKESSRGSSGFGSTG